MAIEIEAKLRVESHGPVRSALRGAGAALIGSVLEWNQIYDRADGSLRRAGFGLRLRTMNPLGSGESLTVLTVKGPRLPGPLKSREEREVVVSDAETAAGMLQMLGYVPILRYEKRRESWSLGECRIELDEPPRIGLFVEIEGPDEPSIGRVQDSLGLGHLQHTAASYVRLLRTYCDEHGLSDATLRLSDESAGDT